MNSGILVDVFTSNALNTGDIRALYNFNDATGCILFNDFYPTGEQVVNGDLTLPVAETYPGISIGCVSNVINNSPTGSGNFVYRDIIRVGLTVDDSDWTFFTNYFKPNIEENNIASVLVSTKDTYTGTSGFVFGVNASNRPYFEYIDVSGINKIHTFSKELNNYNLISVSKFGSNLEIINHDKPNNDNHAERFLIEDYADSNAWHLGNFPTGANPPFTGFSGFMDDFILLGGGYSSNFKNEIADSFFQTGIKSGFISGELVSGREVTGVDVNLTGITGTGVTGHISSLYASIESCLCGDINFYRDSGVSGELFGEIVTFLTGDNFVTGIANVEIPSQKLYDDDYILKYGNKGITFLNKVSGDDRFEVYSHKILTENKIGEDASYLGGSPSTFFTDYSYNTGSGNINVYADGGAIFSGTEFEIIEERKINFTGEDFNSSNTVIYDVIAGSQSASNYLTSGTTMIFVNSDKLNKDVYYSAGSGSINNAVKLISGLEWSGFPTKVEIDGSQNTSGKFLFLPRHAEDFNWKTGYASQYIEMDFNLMNEQVWLNGKRLKINKDYIKVFDKGLLKAKEHITGFGDTFYDNYEDFFNL